MYTGDVRLALHVGKKRQEEVQDFPNEHGCFQHDGDLQMKVDNALRVVVLDNLCDVTDALNNTMCEATPLVLLPWQ